MIPIKHFFKKIKRAFMSVLLYIKVPVMIPEKHLFKQIKRVLMSVLLYISVSFSLVCFFWLVFSRMGCQSPFILSVDSFFGTIPETEQYGQSIHFLALLESLSREIIVVMLLGTIISKMLYPLNPIYLSDHIALDDAGSLRFRYFVVLKKGNFLYDVHIRALVSDRRSMNVGEGQLVEEFSEQLEMIRGVRYSALEPNQTANILNKLFSGNKKIYFIIKGTDENGVCYTRSKTYQINDILEGYKFLSIRRTEYKKLDKMKRLLSDDMFPPATEGTEENDKDFIRYQHFNKLYRIHDNCEESDTPPADVLSERQIIDGEFRGIKQVFLDMRSMIISLYLEGDFKVLKRWFKYWWKFCLKKLRRFFRR